MALVVGVVFFVVRALLALSPVLAMRHAIKKWDGVKQLPDHVIAPLLRARVHPARGGHSTTDGQAH
jgi:hypothetical protein